ncbi:MAG: preprotein translocase subunit SecE [Bacteroidota bacterium]|nr:preprotein translocase subunit SecE [Bacteroidota bacterium]
MSKIQSFIRESYFEMTNKVSWPKYKQLQNSSMLVLIASLIFALMIGLIDYIFNFITTWYYNNF